MVCRWMPGGASEVARFEVFRNRSPHADDVPYLLDVRSDLLQGLETRVVIPLRRCAKALAEGISALVVC